MSNMIPKLKNRIEICTAIQDPQSDGSIETTYNSLLSCWAHVKPISDFVRALRGTNARMMGEFGGNVGTPTHLFTIRKNSVAIGEMFGNGFGDGFDTSVDLNPVKSDMFIFLQKGSDKGRRFKIHGIRHDEQWHEYLLIEAEELYEEGTGWGSLSA